MTPAQIKLMFRAILALFLYSRRGTLDPEIADTLEADLKAEAGK